MRRALMVLVTAGLACSHVKTAKEQAVPKGHAVPKDQPDAGQPDADAPHPHRPKAPPPNTNGSSAKPEAEREAAAPGRPELATSPEGLMLPDGPALIQDALRQRGYLKNDESKKLDGKTIDALQRFQADNGLPSTGAPDRDTLRKLGLSPHKVFRGPKEQVQ